MIRRSFYDKVEVDLSTKSLVNGEFYNFPSAYLFRKIVIPEPIKFKARTIIAMIETIQAPASKSGYINYGS